MPKLKTKTTSANPQTEAEPILQSDEALTEDNETKLADIMVAFDQAPDDVTYKVTIIRMLNGKEIVLERLSDPADIENIVDKLRDDYGGGDFKVRVYEKRGITGRPLIKMQLSYSIAAPRATAIAAQATSEIATLATIMRDQNDRMLAFLERHSHPPAQLDQMAMFDRFLSISEKLRPPQPQNNIEMLSAAVDLVDKVSDIARGTAGGDGETSLLGLLRPFLTPENVQNTLQAFAGGRPLPQPGQQSIAAAPAQPQRQPVSAPTFDNPLELMRQQMVVLVDRARKNSPPSLWAEVIVDTMPIGVVEWVLQQPDILEQMLALNPDAQAFRPWFNELFAELKQQQQTDYEAENAESHVNGAGRQPSGNGGQPAEGQGGNPGNA
jgi:hypothetical protein